MRFSLICCWKGQSETETQPLSEPLPILPDELGCSEVPHRLNQPLSEPLPTLPDELLRSEILHRLPAKSVGRFRSVSKQWRSWLSSPDFVESHLNFHTRYPQHLVFVDHDLFVRTHKADTCYVLTFDRSSGSEDGILRKITHPLENDSHFQVGYPCNGLVVIDVGFDRTKVLMNPFTLEALRVTDCPHDMSSLHGLGYDQFSDDYKIVSAGYGFGSIYVYSVRMKRWKKLPDSEDGEHPFLLHPDDFRRGNGVYANGCIHWMATDNRIAEIGGGRIVICAFDLAREEFKEVQPPYGVDLGEDRYMVKNLRGCLALASKSFCSSVDVWVMENYGVTDSWTKLAIRGPRDYGNVGYEIVSILSEDEVLLSLTKMCKKLVVYNCRSGVWRDVSIADLPQWMRVAAVGESLVSPNYR